MAKGKYQRWIEPDGLLLISGWARDGLTDDQIAKNMGISRSTLNDWRNKYPDISDALKKSKELADREVENALYKRAIGYEYTETKTVISDKDGVKTETVVKQVAPDVTAQIFWLKNRKRDQWRDKIDHDQNVTFESDGFLEALQLDLKATFKDADEYVEE